MAKAPLCDWQDPDREGLRRNTPSLTEDKSSLLDAAAITYRSLPAHLARDYLALRPGFAIPLICIQNRVPNEKEEENEVEKKIFQSSSVVLSSCHPHSRSSLVRSRTSNIYQSAFKTSVV